LAIPGIGEKTARKLLQTFGSVEKIREAPEEELAAILNSTLSRRVVEHFQANAST
jgi:excinuclease ABC subunit C